MAPVLMVLLLIWAAPHEQHPPPGPLFERTLLLTPSEKSAATYAAGSATIAKEAAHFVSSLMAATLL